MIKLKSLIAILLTFGALGCQGTNFETIEVLREREAPFSPTFQGTVDGGGGNSLDGKPLESYAVNMEDLEGIEEIYRAIRIAHEVTPLFGADLLYTLRSKTWFRVPVKLASIDPIKIGTTFTTDQVAVQTFKEVWIDDTMFAEMSVEEQIKLVLHELVMGARIVDLSTSYQKCEAASYEDLLLAGVGEVDPEFGGSLKTFHERLASCSTTYLNISRPAYSAYGPGRIRLKSDDYEAIRYLTLHLWGVLGGEPPRSDLANWLSLHGFRGPQLDTIEELEMEEMDIDTDALDYELDSEDLRE